MKVTYQPEVIQKADEIIEDMTNDNFFEDFEVRDKDIARQTLCDVLTQKFIDGLFNEEFIFTIEEWKKIVNDIIVLDTLNGLKEKGLIESYGDENTNDVFFLTTKGKEVTKKMNIPKTE